MMPYLVQTKSFFCCLPLSGAIGVINGTKSQDIFDKIKANVKDTSNAIYILILIGGLAGTWLVGGIIPAMIYYGLELINATFFYPRQSLLLQW